MTAEGESHDDLEPTLDKDGNRMTAAEALALFMSDEEAAAARRLHRQRLGDAVFTVYLKDDDV